MFSQHARQLCSKELQQCTARHTASAALLQLPVVVLATYVRRQFLCVEIAVRGGATVSSQAVLLLFLVTALDSFGTLLQ